MIRSARKAVALIVLVLALPVPAAAATQAAHTPGALLFTFDQEPVTTGDRPPAQIAAVYPVFGPRDRVY